MAYELLGGSGLSGNYIPLTGTTIGSPVTGNIEITSSGGFTSKNNITPTSLNDIILNDGSGAVIINSTNGTNNSYISVYADNVYGINIITEVDFPINFITNDGDINLISNGTGSVTISSNYTQIFSNQIGFGKTGLNQFLFQGNRGSILKNNGKLITLNASTPSNSINDGSGVGIQVEEKINSGGTIQTTGFFKTTTDRNGWDLKSPNQTGIISIKTPTNSYIANLPNKVSGSSETFAMLSDLVGGGGGGSGITQTQFTNYTAITDTKINTKLNISDFNPYSSSTLNLINNKVDTNIYSNYTANTLTLINNKLNISDFNSYSSTTNTRINNIESNYVSGATNIGAGLGLYSSKNNKSLEFFTLSGGSNVTLTQIGNVVTISSTGGSGGTINNVSGTSYQLQPVFLCATGNLALSGLVSIDGVTPSNGDRILAPFQTTTSNIGIYIASSGSWVRASDSDTWLKQRGFSVSVLAGTTYNGVEFLNTSPASGVLGSTPITWSPLGFMVRTNQNNGSYKGGLKTGDPLGSNALDIQSFRSSNSSVACGSNSVTIGIDNGTNNIESSAIGVFNTSYQCQSSAIGYANTSICSFSSSFGNSNLSNNIYSSSFGFANNSNGECSNAFGYINNSCSTNSSAFGYCNISNGVSSNAFGFCNNVSGITSSSFGVCNKTFNDNTSSVGFRNSSFGLHSHTFGGFNQGKGCYTLSMGYNNTSCCDFSNTVGYFNRACGVNSNAFGQNNVTCGVNSNAIGFENFGVGNNSTAIGVCNNSIGFESTTLGILNCSNGTTSTSIGSRNCAFGDYSTTVGHTNTTTGYSSTVIGFFNISNGSCSNVFGYCNLLNSNLSSSFGVCNFSNGVYSNTFGYKNNSNDYCSNVFGSNINIKGYTTNSFGNGNNTTGCTSNSFGSYNILHGNCSSVFGISNCIYNNYSNAIGYCNKIFSSTSNAIGIENISNNLCTSSFGYANISNGFASNSIGVKNNSTGEESTALGVCSSSFACRSNAIGWKSAAKIECTTVINGPQILPNENYSNFYTAFANLTTAKIYLATPSIDALSSTSIPYSIIIPTGARFYIDTIQIICTEIIGTLSTPITYQIGTTSGGNEIRVSTSPTLTTLDTQFERLSVTTSIRNGIESLYINITNGASGPSVYKLRFIFEGLLMENA